MATTYKISTELYEESFQLIALHTTMSPFTLAYNLNQYCGLDLERSEKDLQLNAATFPLFEGYNEELDYSFYLMGNVYLKEENVNSNGLFETFTSTITNYLIEEYKEASYLLRMDEVPERHFKNYLKKTQAIHKVSLAYAIDVNKLKSKQNLILFNHAN